MPTTPQMTLATKKTKTERKQIGKNWGTKERGNPSKQLSVRPGRKDFPKVPLFIRNHHSGNRKVARGGSRRLQRGSRKGFKAPRVRRLAHRAKKLVRPLRKKFHQRTLYRWAKARRKLYAEVRNVRRTANIRPTIFTKLRNVVALRPRRRVLRVTAAAGTFRAVRRARTRSLFFLRRRPVQLLSFQREHYIVRVRRHCRAPKKLVRRVRAFEVARNHRLLSFVVRNGGKRRQLLRNAEKKFKTIKKLKINEKQKAIKLTRALREWKHVKKLERIKKYLRGVAVKRAVHKKTNEKASRTAIAIRAVAPASRRRKILATLRGALRNTLYTIRAKRRTTRYRVLYQRLQQHSLKAWTPLPGNMRLKIIQHLRATRLRTAKKAIARRSRRLKRALQCQHLPPIQTRKLRAARLKHVNRRFKGLYKQQKVSKPMFLSKPGRVHTLQFKQIPYRRKLHALQRFVHRSNGRFATFRRPARDKEQKAFFRTLQSAVAKRNKSTSARQEFAVLRAKFVHQRTRGVRQLSPSMFIYSSTGAGHKFVITEKHGRKARRAARFTAFWQLSSRVRPILAVLKRKPGLTKKQARRPSAVLLAKAHLKLALSASRRLHWGVKPATALLPPVALLKSVIKHPHRRFAAIATVSSVKRRLALRRASARNRKLFRKLNRAVLPRFTRAAWAIRPTLQTPDLKRRAGRKPKHGAALKGFPLLVAGASKFSQPRAPLAFRDKLRKRLGLKTTTLKMTQNDQLGIALGLRPIRRLYRRSARRRLKLTLGTEYKRRKWGFVLKPLWKLVPKRLGIKYRRSALRAVIVGRRLFRFERNTRWPAYVGATARHLRTLLRRAPVAARRARVLARWYRPMQATRLHALRLTRFLQGESREEEETGPWKAWLQRYRNRRYKGRHPRRPEWLLAKDRARRGELEPVPVPKKLLPSIGPIGWSGLLAKVDEVGVLRPVKLERRRLQLEVKARALSAAQRRKKFAGAKLAKSPLIEEQRKKRADKRARDKKYQGFAVSKAQAAQDPIMIAKREKQANRALHRVQNQGRKAYEAALATKASVAPQADSSKPNNNKRNNSKQFNNKQGNNRNNKHTRYNNNEFTDQSANKNFADNANPKKHSDSQEFRKNENSKGQQQNSAASCVNSNTKPKGPTVSK